MREVQIGDKVVGNTNTYYDLGLDDDDPQVKSQIYEVIGADPGQDIWLNLPGVFTRPDECFTVAREDIEWQEGLGVWVFMPRD